MYVCMYVCTYVYVYKMQFSCFLCVWDFLVMVIDMNTLLGHVF